MNIFIGKGSRKKNRKILKIEEKKRQIDLGPLLVSVPLPDLPKNLHWNLDFLNSGISLHSFSLLKNFFSVAKAIPIPLPFSKRIMLSVGCVLFLYQLTDAIQPHWVAHNSRHALLTCLVWSVWQLYSFCLGLPISLRVS